ncbi:MAG: hypothetical protein LWY06_01405, partial [Firmicutes bacterium]|nr:hypothetical protein [Bacillota bacterium]
YAIIKTSNVSVVDLKTKKAAAQGEGYTSNSYIFSPDIRYEVKLDDYGRQILLTELQTGKTTLLYTENRFGARVEQLLWFPVENRIIASVIFQEMINQKSMDFTEIIAIDPLTSAKTVISPPNPIYIQRNNKIFNILTELSEKAENIRKKLKI